MSSEDRISHEAFSGRSKLSGLSRRCIVTLLSDVPICAVTDNLGTGTHLSGFPTHQDLIGFHGIIPKMMNRKRLQHVADTMCQMFCGWRLIESKPNLVNLGSGILEIDAITGQCVFQGKSIGRL